MPVLQEVWELEGVGGGKNREAEMEEKVCEEDGSKMELPKSKPKPCKTDMIKVVCVCFFFCFFLVCF